MTHTRYHKILKIIENTNKLLKESAASINTTSTVGNVSNIALPTKFMLRRKSTYR